MVKNMKYVILANSNNNEFEIPRQLTVINGEPLVVRTIRLLKENGVKDILITARDKHFDNLGAERYNPINSDYDYNTGTGYWLNAFPFELLNEPVCFIWGDVYFSENAIKTIVETETDDTMFFCSYENHDARYIKVWDEPFAYKVVDTETFKQGIIETKKLYDNNITYRHPIVWELYRVIHGQNVNIHKMTTDYVAINDESCDIDNKNDAEKLRHVVEKGGDIMIKVEATVDFTLQEFDKIKIIKRKGIELKGKIFAGDIFECTRDMCDYLMGGNRNNMTVIKIIEVVPDVHFHLNNDVEKVAPLGDTEALKEVAEDITKQVEVKPKSTKKKKTSKK